MGMRSKRCGQTMRLPIGSAVLLMGILVQCGSGSGGQAAGDLRPDVAGVDRTGGDGSVDAVEGSVADPAASDPGWTDGTLLDGPADDAGSEGTHDEARTDGPVEEVVDGSPDATDAPFLDIADVDPGNAEFRVQGSIHQVFVTHAVPGQALELRTSAGEVVATGTADHLGSLVFRNVPEGTGYRVHAVTEGGEVYSAPIQVLDAASSEPPPSFYSGQTIRAGYGYLTVRDGTTLAYFATLPGPEDQGPYPTVVNYSGYSAARPGRPIVGPDQQFYCTIIPVLCDAPSDPSALLLAVAGYATVSVNIRGTGCSGGAYDYFEELQLLDGYDVIETVAAQPWVLHHRVGMVGLSYPGITQLFVAKTQPPSLAAIAPLSVIGNTATTLMPGGILNDGFALNWIENVYSKAAPYGQGWEQQRVDAGDEICRENQLLHDQRVNNVEQAKDVANYVPEKMIPLNPSAWADRIEVPVFLAGAWQDEQTGPYFTALLDRMTSSPSRRFMLYNGVHVDGFAPQVVAEWKAFLDLHVARQVPVVSGILDLFVPEMTKDITGVSMNLPPDRWTTFKTFEDALAEWASEPEVRVIFENGAGGEVPGAPQGTFSLDFARWPPPETVVSRWYFHADGSLSPDPPTDEAAASHFWLDPEAGERTMNAKNLWGANATYEWKKPDAGYEVSFVSPPLDEDLVFVGTGSVDLWIRSTDADVTDCDLEVNLSEVRPDGLERYVQTGWLRASFRTLTADSTELWPEPTYILDDNEPLEPGVWTLVRVAIPGFAHVFRQGSRIRIAVDTPGDSRPEWRFDLIEFPHPTGYDVAHSATYPSSVALPRIPTATVPADRPLPACPSLRAQPCRPYTETPNAPAGGV